MAFVLLAAIFLTSSGFLVSTLATPATPTAIAPAETAAAEAIAPVSAPRSDEDMTARPAN
jgi:hypothetical protein